MEEKTGSNDYLARRVKHSFNATWVAKKPRVRTFDDLDKSTKSEVLYKIELAQDDIPLILYYVHYEHWLLLTVYEMHWKSGTERHSMKLNEITDINFSWGDLTEEQRNEIDNNVKLSGWIRFGREDGSSEIIHLPDDGLAIWSHVDMLHRLGKIHNRTEIVAVS